MREQLEKYLELVPVKMIADRLPRFVALVLILIALQYWVRLIGVFPGEQYRFDTMSEQWRFASSVMAVALPVTALGLWNGTSWGIVLWLPVAATEIAMHTWLGDVYGGSILKVVFHLVTVTAYLLNHFAQRFLANNSLTKPGNTP